MDVADLRVRLGLTGEQQVARGLSNVGQQLSDFGRKAQIAGALLTVGLTLPILALGKKAISAASDLAESQSKVNVVFGEYRGIINEWAKTSAESVGLSRQAALDTAGAFGNLFTTMKIGERDAANMSTQMVQLGADLASFHNVSVEEATTALRSGLVGETEPLRRLGIVLNEDAVAAKALEMGLAGSKEEMTEADKVAARYALIMEQAGNAQGDFARTSDGLANQQRILKANLGDLAATMGQILLPIAIRIVGWINSLVQAFGRLPQGMKTFIVLAGLAAAALGPLLTFLGTLATVLGAISLPLLLVGAAFAGLFAVLASRAGGVGALLETIGNAVSGLVEGFAKAFTTGDAWGDWLDKVPEPMRRTAHAIASIADSLGDLFRAFQDRGIEGLFNTLFRGGEGEQIATALGAIFEEGWQLFVGTAKALVSGGVQLGELAIDALPILGAGLAAIAGNLWGWVKGKLLGYTGNAMPEGDLTGGPDPFGYNTIPLGNLLIEAALKFAGDLLDATTDFIGWVTPKIQDAVSGVIRVTGIVVDAVIEEINPQVDGATERTWRERLKLLIEGDPIEVSPKVEAKIEKSTEQGVRDAVMGLFQLDASDVAAFGLDWGPLAAAILTGPAGLVAVVGTWFAAKAGPDLLKVLRAGFQGVMRGLFLGEEVDFNPFGGGTRMPGFMQILSDSFTEWLNETGRAIQAGLVNAVSWFDGLADNIWEGITGEINDLAARLAGMLPDWVRALFSGDLKGAFNALTGGGEGTPTLGRGGMMISQEEADRLFGLYEERRTNPKLRPPELLQLEGAIPPARTQTGTPVVRLPDVGTGGGGLAGVVGGLAGAARQQLATALAPEDLLAPLRAAVGEAQGIAEELRSAVANEFVGLGSDVGTLTAAARTAASNEFVGLRDDVATLAEGTRTDVGNAFVGLREDVATLSEGARTAAGNAFVGLREDLGSLAEGARMRVANAFVGMRSDIAGIVGSLAGVVAGAMANVAAAAANAGFSAGLAGSAGVAQGLLAGLGAVQAASNALAFAASGGLAAALDIQSPSKVMARLGRFATEGFVRGMLADLPMVTDATGRLGRAAGAISVSGGAGGGGGSRGDTYIFKDNVMGPGAERWIQDRVRRGSARVMDERLVRDRLSEVR